MWLWWIKNKDDLFTEWAKFNNIKQANYRQTDVRTDISNSKAVLFRISTFDHLRNRYISHRIIDSFPRIIKWNIIRLKPVLVFILIFVKNCLKYDNIHQYSVWLRTGSICTNINRFQIHTGKFYTIIRPNFRKFIK